MIKRIRCWLKGHVWWEHWHMEKVDHCVKCDLERPHYSDGCTCTICQFPGGLDEFKKHEFTKLLRRDSGADDPA